MKYAPPISTLTAILLPLWLFGQTPSITFQQISTAEGLSQSVVNCLLKDMEGGVWAGTQDGLNRYDGQTFVSYVNDPEEAGSLSNNYILELYQEEEGAIWVGTNGGGLCRYRAAVDRFETYLLEVEDTEGVGQNVVRAIIATRSGTLLVGTDAGLFELDPEDGCSRNIGGVGAAVEFKKSVYAFQRLSPDWILLGSIGTLLLYNESSKRLIAAKLNKPIEGGFHCFGKAVGTEYLWAGTGKGLLQLNWQKDTDSIIIHQQYTAQTPMPSPISSNYISALLPDKSQGLWIATNQGLNFLDQQKTTPAFQHFLPDPQGEHSLSHHLLFDLLEVEDGIIWAASQSGVNQFLVKPPLFNGLDLSQLSLQNCGSSVHGMAQEAKGALLACTENGLLHIAPDFNSTSPSIRCLDNPSILEGLSDRFLVSISPGRGDHFWLAMRRGGYARLSPQGNTYQLEAYKLPAGAYENVGTNDFVETANGDLWIASSGLGLWKWKQQENTFTSFTKQVGDSTSLSGNYLFYLLDDPSGFLWIASADGGLCKMDKKMETFTCFTHEEQSPQSISSNMVLSVFIDQRKRVWACTANGLNLLTPEGGFIRFSKKEGLPNNVIYGMLEDANHQLWVSTDQGIARINYEAGRFEVKSYSQNHGLLRQEFNQHAFLKLQDGQLAFGAQGGINYFAPAAVVDYAVVPKVVFTDFKLFNETVPIQSAEAGNTFSLSKHINHTTAIDLSHEQNFIAFEFTGINFERAEANQYAYQLEGLDEDWVYVGNRKYAGYSGLAPGEYTFRVKVANHDGLWTETPRSIAVRVATPPWKTWWAYAIYLFVLFSIVYTIFQYRLYHIRKIEETKQRERILFRKRSAQDFHDEAGNQITKISLMAAIAKRKTQGDAELRELLSQIGDHIQTLRSGMRDFIWVLDPDKDNLYETLLRLKESANDMFEYAAIRFSTTGIEEQLQSRSLSGNQRRNILLIFKETINNCLKYSQAKQAHFTVRQEAQQLVLEFWDDGIGFDPKTQSKGYGLQNMQTRSEKINAHLSIDTTINVGTAVRLTLDITQMGD